MSVSDFLVVYAIALATMLASRCAPMFLLRSRELPERAREAISLIPVAAFTALVANDLSDLDLFATDPFHGVMTLVASLVVVVVARLTRSLIWCALAGMAAYSVLVYLV